MRKIDRKEEPDFWIKYKRSHPREQYSDLDKSEIGCKLRHKMRRYLLQSQYGLCAYCCRKIGMDDSLNEHIKPQSDYPNESMDYDNLIVSCKMEGRNVTCGNKKGNEYDEELFVSPLETHCGEKFIFYPNGHIEGVGKRGKYTCHILNLDSYELQRARMAQYKICTSYQDSEMVYTYFLTPSEKGQMEPYSDMIQYFYERGDFDIVEN